MATWIKCRKNSSAPVLIDLDKVFAFVDRKEDDRIRMLIGNTYFDVEQNEDPETFIKILYYMGQIEEQIK